MPLLTHASRIEHLVAFFINVVETYIEQKALHYKYFIITDGSKERKTHEETERGNPE